MKTKQEYWVPTVISKEGLLHFLKFLEHSKKKSVIARRAAGCHGNETFPPRDSGFSVSHWLDPKATQGYKVRTSKG